MLDSNMCNCDDERETYLNNAVIKTKKKAAPSGLLKAMAITQERNGNWQERT